MQKKEIILSTFAFQSDESGKLILGALHDAADRGVHIRLLVDGMESWIDMEGNPYFYGLSSHENVEIKLYNKANPLKPWKMMGRMHDKYLIADGKRYILGGRNTYNYFLGDFPGHKNYDRDVLVVCDEPEKENSVNQLLEYFETIWEQEDSDYFHDNKKLANRKSVKNAVLELQNGYQKYFEENKASYHSQSQQHCPVVAGVPGRNLQGEKGETVICRGVEAHTSGPMLQVGQVAPDFPPPVGINTNVSLPANRFSMIAS